MSLSSQAVIDFNSNLYNDGSSIKLYNESGELIETQGRINRIEGRYDPQTGTIINAPECYVSIPVSELEERPTGKWQIEINDNTGELLRGRISSSREDRTLGFYNLQIEDIVILT